MPVIGFDDGDSPSLKGMTRRVFAIASAYQPGELLPHGGSSKAVTRRQREKRKKKGEGTQVVAPIGRQAVDFHAITLLDSVPHDDREINSPSLARGTNQKNHATEIAAH